MIFSEIYSLYYKTVGMIVNAAFEGEISDEAIRNIIRRNAFSESALTILPALKSGKWQILDESFKPVLRHKYNPPLTLIEKQWLKAITNDPKIKLFGTEFPELKNIEPLFNYEDYKIYDQYADGDNFSDSAYIENFRLILDAIKEGSAIAIKMKKRSGKMMEARCIPVGFEYSLKDDKIRIKASGCRFPRFNLGRIIECRLCEGENLHFFETKKDAVRELTLLITDERNTPERAMVHFSHFEKQAMRGEDGKYIVKLKYYAEDETEILIRVLSFGPLIRVLEPQRFVELVRSRLLRQKNWDLKSE